MPEPRNGRGALATGGVAAILASTCCLVPLVTFDDTKADVHALTRATTDAGYPSELKR